MQIGRQPGQAIAYAERWSVSALARKMNVPVRHLYNSFYGWAHPSDEIREQLPVILGRPLEDLFTPESLAKPYTGPRGNRFVQWRNGEK